MNTHRSPHLQLLGTAEHTQSLGQPPSLVPVQQYTIKRAADILDYSVRTVYRLIKAGELHTTGRRHLLRVTAESLAAYQQRIRNGKEAS
jgi:excisionase family DNA binding protein